MDKLKSAVGIDKKDQEGQEPVSGATGEGTTAEPFDAGNNPETTESAAKGQTPNLAGSSTESKTEPTTSSTTEETTKQEASTEDSTETKSGIGSKGWFASSNPFSKSKDSDKDKSDIPASSGAEQPTQQQRDPSPERPPNHLGVNVPSGTTDDLAPDSSKAPGASTMTENKEQESQQVANASANNADTSAGWQGKLDVKEDNEDKWSPGKWEPGQMQDTTNKQQQHLQPSGPKLGQLRGSRASIAAPAGEPRREGTKTNPASIPTAGGQVMGQRASEARAERRASRVSEDLSPPPSKIDKRGSPDPVTEENTVGNGEGSSRMASVTEDEEGGPKDANAKPQENVAGAAAPAPAAKPDERSDSLGKLSPSTANKSGETPTKERRGSTMENLKAKFKKLGS